MTYFNERKKELKDEKILDALEKCKEMYMNGEVAEIRDILINIVNAIDVFEKSLS